jgi:bifunctional ADP-heptose synthase (sugar kinase/adenylyltransferase)
MTPQERIDQISRLRVLVVGDTIVDADTELEQVRPLEDGTDVYHVLLEPVRNKSHITSLGGAALVVRNLLELGATVDFISSFGYGEYALAANSFQHPRLKKHGIAIIKPQTAKQRFWCGERKVMQIDTFDNSPLVAEDEDVLLTTYYDLVEQVDLVVVADYRHGLISERLACAMVDTACEHTVPIYVASQVSQSPSNHDWYDGAILVMNEREFAGSHLRDNYAPRVVTLGAQGSMATDAVDGIVEHDYCRAVRVDAVDPCGAGDAYLAAFATTGDQQFANLWAALACTIKGPQPPTVAMLEEWYNEHRAKEAA